MQINPEQGLNYEVSLKGKERSSGVIFELTAYQMKLTNAILPRDTSIFVGTGSQQIEVTYYLNSGSATQRGVELMLQRNFVPKSAAWWNSLNFIAAATIQDYKFGDYTLNDVSYGGKLFPGTPGHTATFGAQFTCLNDHLMLSVQDYWFDKTPLNMTNTVYLPAYHLMNTKLEGKWDLWNELISIIGGVGYNNVLNTEYTSFANLNNAAGKFYNPMQLGNAYGSLTIKANIR
jgi:outer membrane receptor for ferrienterochelin and colicin